MQDPPEDAGNQTSKDSKMPKPPPQPLTSHTPPSRRHLLGLPRCQRWRMRDGAFWQCSKPARLPLKVCPRHGAGFARRENAGERINPVLPSAFTEPGAKRAVAILLEQHPELQGLYGHHLASPMVEALDFRPYLAAAKALVDAYVQRTRLEGGYGPMGTASSIERALGTVEKLLGMAERFLGIEAKLGPVTQLELAWMRYAYAATLAEYVPAEKLEQAREFCRRKLAEAREVRTEGRR